MADVTVYGKDALARELGQLGVGAALPVALVTDPAELAGAAADLAVGGVLAVTSFSAGGETLRRQLAISRPIATFGATVPLADLTRSEIALPPGLSGKERQAWQATLAGIFGDVVWVAESPGLVTARILAGLVNEAAYLAGETGVEPEAIDEAMKLGVNYPLGPLLWGDMIGLDTVHRLLLALSDAYGRERHRPAPLLIRHVLAGETGVLAGQGFYTHRRA